MEKNNETWSDIGLDELFFAYRKAKADCYFETSVRVAERFIRFEGSLGERIERLLLRLQAGEIGDVLSEGLGAPAIFPKKVVAERAEADVTSHAFFSDARRAFQRQRSTALSPEFRIIGDFSVEVHVLSALWVNLVGHKFDAQLRETALASRLRRYRRDPKGNAVGSYHLEAIGSFEPYFEPYRRWRDQGLDTIRASLERDQEVVALTLDVGSFYHSIDPNFAIDADFLEYAGIKLSSFEVEFTSHFVEFLNVWSQRSTQKIESFGCHGQSLGGLPIGLSVVRVLANSVLLFLDREIESSASPIYYARYVDDIFLVVKDQQDFESQLDVWHSLMLQIPALKRDEENGNIELRLPRWAGNTKLLFNLDKQKCFFLSGRAGLDLLNNIASQIREVSSERRLMPLPEQLDQTQSARALASTDSADDADTLRRADGLTIRRLGWSILLRSVEVLASDLEPGDWEDERERFYEFAHDHVIRPDKILDQIDRLPRLFALAVSLEDWKPALKIWKETLAAIYQLQDATAHSKMKINGHTCQNTPADVWDETRAQVLRFFREALIRAMPTHCAEPQAKSYHSLLDDLGLEASELSSLARAAREADWARIPYKEHIRDHADRHAPTQPNEELLYNRYGHEAELRLFLERSAIESGNQSCNRVSPKLSGAAFESLLPYLFPTRAYTAEEIALYLPSDCVEANPVAAAHSWAQYTRAVRGVWVRSKLAENTLAPFEPEAIISEPESDALLPATERSRGSSDGREPPKLVLTDGSEREFPVRVGITSFATSDQTWALGASGRPDLSPARYKAIAKIVNAALNEDCRPNYLVFPELSIPERWIRTISSRLREGRISLIAGLDYRLHNGGLIDSSAVLVLSDKRLGYSTSIQIRQRKSQPAPGEELNLQRSHGRIWNNPCTEFKPVYVHHDFCFSVLVCSELQNIEYRSCLQGHLDCLFILSWNKDLETFSSLVDSASLDMHAYVALSNNLRYGDSRVRSPAKASYLRDVCRVRGGVNDQLVVVEIDPRDLRAQQSRAKRWPVKNDRYKPAPEGFSISDRRRTTPS